MTESSICVFFTRILTAAHHVLAEEDVVVVLATVKAERNGRSAAFPEVHVWRLANAKVTEFREFQGDEQTEDRFWS